MLLFFVKAIMNAELQESYMLSKLFYLRNVEEILHFKEIITETFPTCIALDKFRDRYWLSFEEFLKNKFPELDDKVIERTETYHEHPDMTKKYSFSDIVSTFNSITELGKLFHMKYTPYDDEHYLTEKSYGNSCGNVMVDTIFEDADIQYVHENPEADEYLLSVEQPSSFSLVLLKQKLLLTKNDQD